MPKTISFNIGNGLILFDIFPEINYDRYICDKYVYTYIIFVEYPKN